MIYPQTSRKSRAFSLIELITVIAIMAILFTLVAGVTSSTTQATALTAAGEGLHNRLVGVQQRAIATNNPINVIVYRYTDETGNPEARGVGFFEEIAVVDSAGLVSVSVEKAANDFVLNAPFVLSSGQANSSPLSTLADPASGMTLVSGSQPSPDPFLEDEAFAPAADDASRSYTGFRFLPDGSTDLATTTASSDQWHLTVVRAFPGVATSADMVAPANYFCIRIDPTTGRAERWRP